MAHARVERYNGYPALIVNGEALPPMTLTTSTKDLAYLRRMAEAGVRVFFEPCATTWLDPNSLADLTERAERLLEAAPDAYIILRVSLHPSAEWIRENPGELVTYDDGSQVKAHPHGFLWPSYDPGEPNVYSLHSRKWREDGGKALREFIGQVSDLPFADRVIGYFLAAGGTSEWYSMAGTLNRDTGIVSDYSDAFRMEFSGRLRAKYGTDEALAEAWGVPEASLDDPAIPDFASRKVVYADDELLRMDGDSYAVNSGEQDGTIGSFLNPDTHQNVADFYEAWHLGTADSIVHFASIAKEATGGNQIVGAFYGSYGCTHFFETGTVSGVLRILDSDVVDFLASPGLYENRLPRGYTAQREMHDSFLIRNRMFVSEEDTRTYRSGRLNCDFTGTHTVADTITVMKRDFGRNLCDETQAWWFDMAPQGGWYDDPDVADLIRRQQEIARFAYESDRTKANEIALIYDEESTRYISNLSSVDICQWMRGMELHRIGAPVDFHFHNDLALDEMPDYKLYVFMNVFHLSDAERKQIDRKVKRNGQTALWLYAPGVINPDRTPRFSVDHIGELVGMNVASDPGPLSGRFTLADGAHPITKHTEPDRIYGFFDRPVLSRLWDSSPPNTRLSPMFYPEDDGDVEVLGRFLTNGKPALVARRFDDWTSVYCGAKVVRSDLLRSVARYARCHVYGEQDECIYANRRFVVIHAKDTGVKRLVFPRTCDPYEVYERKFYGRSVDRLDVEMRAGETLTFHLDGEC